MWTYKAYDENLRIHVGNEEADDFLSLALNLRQRGLQIFEAKKLNDKEAILENRLMMLKGMPKNKHKKHNSIIHRILLKIKSMFTTLHH